LCWKRPKGHSCCVPFGRLVLDEADGVATFVDFALLPESRGGGLGTAVTLRLMD
jgi:hypothetical protein